jgi:hypothetical protein
MAFLLEVATIDGGDGSIKVVHQFYGFTEEECRTYMREHIGSCSYFKSAKAERRIIESLEEIDDDQLPTPDDWDEEDEEE